MHGFHAEIIREKQSKHRTGQMGKKNDRYDRYGTKSGRERHGGEVAAMSGAGTSGLIQTERCRGGFYFAVSIARESHSAAHGRVPGKSLPLVSDSDYPDRQIAAGGTGAMKTGCFDTAKSAGQTNEGPVRSPRSKALAAEKSSGCLAAGSLWREGRSNGVHAKAAESVSQCFGLALLL